MKLFSAPEGAFGPLGAADAAAMIAATSDLSLVIGQEGIIEDVAVGSNEPALGECGAWIGQSWSDIVTEESRPKVEALLRDAGRAVSGKWRHLNHPTLEGPDIPLLYSAIGFGAQGKVLAFARDLRPVSALQQRLIEAQQSMEREYWRFQHLETRYRLLFQLSTEAVLIVDSASEKILEANPAAGTLLGDTAKRGVGKHVGEYFSEASAAAIRDMLAAVRATGRAEDVQAPLASIGVDVVVSASLFRQENNSLYLLRISRSDQDTASNVVHRSALKVMEAAPDGFVVTSPEGEVLLANGAFADLAQMPSADQITGKPLERWLGRAGVDFDLLVANLRQHGSVRLFETIIRGEHGSMAEVEVSAVAVTGGELPCLGFTIRNIGRRLTGADTRQGRKVPRSVEQLAKLVGRVALKDLVRESTDLIERLCIEAALELTNDNRASAAEMLGLSRQSLYVKLRRHGLGDLTTEIERS